GGRRVVERRRWDGVRHSDGTDRFAASESSHADFSAVTAVVKLSKCLSLAFLFAAIEASATESMPLVIVRTVDGAELRGTIKSWSADSGLILQQGPDRSTTTPTANVDRVENPTSPKAISAEPWWMFTTDGQLLAGDIDGGSENDLIVRNAALGSLRLP